MNDTPDAVYWASAFIMWAMTIGGTAFLWRYIRRLRAATANVQVVAQEREEMQEWAHWTILSVTERDGTIWAATIAELFRERGEEKVWADPIATALWCARPVKESPAPDEKAERG